MKKSLKILGLILSLALICGALVVAAFATDEGVTGVTTVDSFDLQDKSEQVYDQALSATAEINFTGKTKTCYVGRYGQPSIVTSPYDGNNYLVWTLNTNWSVAGGNSENANFPVGTMGAPTNKWGGAGYIWTNVSNTPSIQTPSPNPLKNYSYYVVEADIRTPSGLIPHQMSFNMFFHYINSSEGNTTPQNQLWFEMENGAPIVFDNTAKDSAGHWLNWRTLNNSQWTHITWITEIKMLNEGNTLATYCHVYLNGEYAWSYAGTQVTADKTYKGDISTLCLRELRINLPGTLDAGNNCEYNDAGQQITWTDFAIDNYSIRSISTDSNTNLGEVIAAKSDITEWDANIYNADEMPFGVPAAKNVDTEKVYDSLQKAVNEAEESETIELLADSATTVSVQNTIQIKSNGYKCNVEAINPFMYTLEDGVYYFEESSEALAVIWSGCGHIDGCEDEAHPGGIETEVLLNGNIYNSYTKNHSWSYSDEETGTLYTLVGWERGDTGELLTAEDTVDEELLDQSILELYPIFSTTTYAYEYVNSAGETVKEYDTVELNTVLANAKKGTTVKLLGDYVMNSQVVVKNDVTLDLNGYTLDNIQPSTVSKYATFSVNSDVSFTLTTSRPGAKIFAGHDKGTGGYNGNACVQASKGATVIIDGSKGLQVWTTVIYMSYGNSAGTLYINGGEYYDPKSIGDQDSFLQIDTTEYVELKNAMFYADRGILGFGGGGYTEYPAEAAKVIIDNCAFLSNTVIMRSNKYIDVTITNSYLGGSLNAGSVGVHRSGCLAPVQGGTWTLGEGNYIASGAPMSDNVVVKEGLVSHEMSVAKTYKITMNTFTNNDREASKVLTETEETFSFGTYISAPAQPAKITWYDTDGVTVLGVTEDTLPGMTATAPSTPVAELDGWLNATFAQWTNPEGVETTVVPTGVTEYSFKLVEGSEIIYTVGTVPVYINYDLVLHIQLNIYIPKNAPEGITIQGTKYTAPTSGGSGLAASGTYIIGGAEYGVINRWPNAARADEDATISVTFEYKGASYTYTTPAYNIGDYAQIIFAGEYSAEIKQTTLSALEYIEAANKITGATVSEEVVNAIAAAATAGVSIETPDLAAGEAIDESAVKDYIDSIQVAYNTSNGGVQFRFYKTQKAIDEAATVAVIWNGHKSATSATDATSGSWPQTTNEYGKAFWYTHNTRAYDIDGTFTIQVKVGGAVVASLEYSFEAYAAAVKESCTAEQWELMMTTLAFAKYAEVVKK